MRWYDPRSWFVQRTDESKALTSDVLRDWMAGSGSTMGGVSVNWTTAMQASVVLACARVISEGLSQVPFRLMRTAGEMRETATEHPLYPLIEWAPNEWQTSTEMMDQIGIHLVIAGNAYVWLNRSRGRVVEMLPWEPQAVQVKRDALSIKYVLSTVDGKRQEVAQQDMWHLRGPSWDGVLGLDVVRLAREAIGLSLSAERSVSGTMANGARITGILSTDAVLTREQRQQLRESWQESQAGAANAGKIAVMSNGMKFQPMANTAVDTQQIENRKFQVEEVCRAMRVMPLMVGYSDKTATYASAEQMFLAHVTHTMGPWYRRVERSAGVALLTPQERDAGYYFKFFPVALLRGAAADRAAFYTALYNVGALSPNEIRAFEDLNPYTGGESYRVPLNMEDPANPDPEPEPTEDPTEESTDEPT